MPASSHSPHGSNSTPCILIATSQPPFGGGGNLLLARELTRQFNRHNVTSELIVTPQSRFGWEIPSYLAHQLYRIDRTADDTPINGLISLRYPAFALYHPNHLVWLCHRMRSYYDLWNNVPKAFPSNALKFKESIRRFLLHRFDRALLRRRTLFAISNTVRDRLKKWSGLSATVLYPPPPERPYRSDEYQNFVLAVSRLTPQKRLDLLIHAVAVCPNNHLQAVIVGEGPCRAELESVAEKAGVADKIRFTGRQTDQQLCDLYASCRAVVFTPLQEDFGFVTLEAMRSQRPVITCTDSGGAAELVSDKVTGFIVPPNPGAIAEKLALLADNRLQCQEMGGRGLEKSASLTWPDTVAKLRNAMEI